MTLQAFRLDDYSGGINDVDSLMRLDPTECTWDGTTDVELFGDKGMIGPRRAFNSFATTGAALPTTVSGVNRITNIRTYRNPAGPGDILIWSNAAGIIQKCDPNDANNTVTTILAAGSNAEFEFIQAQDSGTTEYVWCLNGLTAPQKYSVGAGVLAAWAGTPPNGRFHRVWKNMMIISGVAAQPQRVYYSAIANPESWPANNFIDIKSTDDENEAITALEVIGENLLVFKARSLWLVFDPVSLENRRISDIGCVGRGAVCRSVNQKEETIYWVAREGVYSTDGDEVKQESKKIDRRFNDSSITWSRFLYGFRQFTRLVMLDDGKLYLLNWEGIGLLNFNTILFCDTKRTRPDGQHPWFRNTGSMSAVTCMTPVFYRGHNVGNAEFGGQIGVFDPNGPGGGAQTLADLLVDGDITDDGSDVVGSYETGWMEITPSTEKMERVRRINIHGDGNVQIDLQADEGGPFSSGTLVAGGLSRFARYRPDARGRFFQFKMTLSLGARISQVELMYRGGLEH